MMAVKGNRFNWLRLAVHWWCHSAGGARGPSGCDISQFMRDRKMMIRRGHWIPRLVVVYLARLPLLHVPTALNFCLRACGLGCYSIPAGGGGALHKLCLRICAGNNSKRPLFLMSNYWEPYIICSLIFQKWHRFCGARICRFIFPSTRNPPPLR